MMYFAAGLPRRIATLGERAQARLEGSQQRSENGGEGESLDEASLKRLLSLLKQQQASLAALEVCRQTPLDFGITRIYRPNRVAVQKPDGHRWCCQRHLKHDQPGISCGLGRIRMPRRT